MRMELRRSWHESRETTFAWRSREPWTSYMLSVDGSTTSSHRIYPWRLLSFCNKPTVLYWAHSAQRDDRCPLFIWASILKEWFRCYNLAPRMDFKYFFANPVCITSTGPRTISELLETHEAYCSATFSFLDRLRRGENEHAYMDDAWPDQYKLLPVCRAIIVILDELVPVHFHDCKIYLDLEVRRQNIVMVRTGKETSLSEPISFDDILDQALPLSRPDLETRNDIDAIRVPLATAVQFIVNLQRREEAAFPDSAPSTAVDRSLCPSTHPHESDSARITNVDDWVDRIMELADEGGIDKVPDARAAMSAVQEAQRGEDPGWSCPCYFDRRWR